MKAYRVELLIIDLDGIGEEEIIKVIEQYTHYPNHCINPHVAEIESAEIGEWDDDHPLNNPQTMEEEYHRLFGICNEQEL